MIEISQINNNNNFEVKKKKQKKFPYVFVYRVGQFSIVVKDEPSPLPSLMCPSIKAGSRQQQKEDDEFKATTGYFLLLLFKNKNKNYCEISF
jgi:hypothetical protein